MHMKVCMCVCRKRRREEWEKRMKGRQQEREQNSAIFFKILFLNPYLTMPISDPNSKNEASGELQVLNTSSN